MLIAEKYRTNSREVISDKVGAGCNGGRDEWAESV